VKGVKGVVLIMCNQTYFVSEYMRSFVLSLSKQFGFEKGFINA